MIVYRVFSLMWPTSMQIYWNKRKRLHTVRREFNSQRIGLGHQHGRLFIVLDTNMAAVTSCENTLINNFADYLSYRALEVKAIFAFKTGRSSHQL